MQDTQAHTATPHKIVASTELAMTRRPIFTRRWLVWLGLLSSIGACALWAMTCPLPVIRESTAALASVGVAGICFVIITISRRDTMLCALENSLAERGILVEQLESERSRLTSLLRAAVSYSIIGTDERGIITSFNEGASLMLGYRAEEVLGRQTPLLIHDLQEIAARARVLGVPADFHVFRTVPNMGISDAREWTYISKSGERIPVWLSVTAIKDQDGNSTGYVGVARDISADKRNQYDRDAMLQVGRELLCSIDEKGYLRVTSPAFARMLGFTSEDLRDRSVLDFVHPQDVGRTQQRLEDIVDGIPAHYFENRWRTKGGAFRWIRWACSTLSVDGRYYASGWDVTGEKAREHDRERHLRFEQQLVGIVGHDLRTPLNTILLCAEMLETYPDLPVQATEQVRLILGAVRRAERLSYDMLDFTAARLGRGLSICPAETDVVAILQRAVDEARQANPQRQIILDAPYGTVTPVDAARFDQAFGNLLTNSLKYSPDDTSIHICCTATPSHLVLEVHNAGPPISRSLLPLLFEPLRRATCLPQLGSHSIGLGLYIVKEIVQAHGGKISVESSADKGTIFRMMLPQDGGLVSLEPDQAVSGG